MSLASFSFTFVLSVIEQLKQCILISLKIAQKVYPMSRSFGSHITKEYGCPLLRSLPLKYSLRLFYLRLIYTHCLCCLFIFGNPWYFRSVRIPFISLIFLIILLRFYFFSSLALSNHILIFFSPFFFFSPGVF